MLLHNIQGTGKKKLYINTCGIDKQFAYFMGSNNKGLKVRYFLYIYAIICSGRDMCIKRVKICVSLC